MSSRAARLAGFSTNISTSGNLSVGVITATSFVGSGAGLTGVSGIATNTSINTSGIVTASSFVGNVTGNLTGTASTAIAAGTASTATAAGTAYSLTGSPNIVVGISTVNTSLRLTGNYVENVISVSALDIDCSSGNYFIKTINTNSTFTVSNVPSSGAYSFVLELTHTSGNITWFSGVQWPGGSAPTLTTGKTHLFIFVTDDGGTRWRGASLVDYTN